MMLALIIMNDVNGRPKMAVSYDKLWKLLIDKKMSAADLRRSVEISPNTMTRLRKGEHVNMATIERICTVLKCDFSDVMELVEEDGGHK